MNILLNDHATVLETDEKIKKKDIYRADRQTRSMLEKGVKYIYNLESSSKPDPIFSRRSNLNQVLAKIAHEKGSTIIFNHTLLKNAKNPNQVLGRMQLNYKLCKKYKVNTLVAAIIKKETDKVSPEVFKSFENLLKKKTLYRDVDNKQES